MAVFDVRERERVRERKSSTKSAIMRNLLDNQRGCDKGYCIIYDYAQEKLVTERKHSTAISSWCYHLMFLLLKNAQKK